MYRYLWKVTQMLKMLFVIFLLTSETRETSWIWSSQLFLRSLLKRLKVFAWKTVGFSVMFLFSVLLNWFRKMFMMSWSQFAGKRDIFRSLHLFSVQCRWETMDALQRSHLLDLGFDFLTGDVAQSVMCYNIRDLHWTHMATENTSVIRLAVCLNKLSISKSRTDSN